MGEPYIRPRKGSIEKPLRIAVLISGSGSGLLALLNHQQSNKSPHSTKLIISDNENAGGLRHGEDFAIPAVAIPLPDLTDKHHCLLYTSPSPRDATLSRMPSSA